MAELEGRNMEAVYIPRSIYNSMLWGGGTVILEFNNDVEQQIFINILSDIKFANMDTVNVGDVIDVASLFEKTFDITVDKSKYDIESYPQGSTNNHAMVQSEENIFEFECVMTGSWLMQLINTDTGIKYEMSVRMTAEGAPLKIDDFVLSEGAVFEDHDETQLNCEIMPESGTIVLNHMDLAFTLPEGAVMNWNKTSVNYDDSVGTKLASGAACHFDCNFSGDRYSYDLAVEQEESDVKFVFDSEEGMVMVPFTIAIDYNGRTFSYSMLLGYNYVDINTGSVGYSTYTYLPNSVVPISEFFLFDSDEDKEKFIKYVNDDIVYLDCSDAEFLFENGQFIGNMIFYRPINYLSVKQRPVGQLNGYEVNIRMKANTVVKTGESVNLSELLNGYNHYNGKVKVFENNVEIENTVEENMVFTAPVCVFRSIGKLIPLETG